jgi:hypothetical protein
MVNILIITTLLIFCVSPAFPQGASFSGTRGSSLNGRISPGGSFSATDEDGNFVNGHVSPGGHLQATDSNGNFINGNISPSGFFSGTDSNGNFLNGKVRNQDDDMLNTNPLGNDASRNSIYPTEAIDFSPDDELGKAVRAVQILETLDSIGRRDQEAAFQKSQLEQRKREMQQQQESISRQMEMRLKEFELNKSKEDRVASQQKYATDQRIAKTIAARSLADFASMYDPTDVDHRSKLEWYKNWAIAQGVSAEEVNQGLVNVDKKTAALDNQLASLRASSGIQDWETIVTLDGKRKIDIGATIAKAHNLKHELDSIAKNWGYNDRLLQMALTNKQASIENPSERMSSAQIIALVNENRQILLDYQNVVGEGLWIPPEGFTEKFVKRNTQNEPTISKDQIGYAAPVMYDANALELDPAYMKARVYAERIARGEEPEFVRNKDTGEIEYETTQGGGKVAKIARWVDTKKVTTKVKLIKNRRMP